MSDALSARQRALATAIVVTGGLSVWLWPERLPGLNVDEAWSFFRANEILSGLRPLDGMNYYTGALHHYLLAGAVQLLGLHVWVLRLLSGGANLLMLIAYMLIVRRMHPGRDIWLWSAALCATSTAFVVYSRLGIELCTLGPLLIVGGALLVQRSATQVSSWRWPLAFAGGALLGLAVYNHMAAAATVAALLLGYVVATGLRGLPTPHNVVAALGLLAGLAPRMVQLSRLPAHGSGPGKRLLKNLSTKVLDDLVYLPELLRGMLEGDLVYQRVAGGTLLVVLPFFSVALGLLLLVRLRARRLRPRRRDVGWLVGTAASALLMVLISDHLALRYYVLTALGMSYVLARLASLPPAPDDAAAEPRPGEPSGARLLGGERTPRWIHRFGRLTLISVIALQCLYVGTNYFFAHLTTGGKIHVFPLGKHVMEASNGFVRTDRLYARLVDMHIPYVVADNLIRWPLELYDIPGDHFRGTAQPYDGRWRVPNDWPTALVYYNGPTPMGGLKLEDRRGPQSVVFNRRSFTLEPGIDPNFIVFIHRPKAAATRRSALQDGAQVHALQLDAVQDQ